MIVASRKGLQRVNSKRKETCEKAYVVVQVRSNGGLHWDVVVEVVRSGGFSIDFEDLVKRI